MSVAIKAALVAVCGFVLLMPLAMIGLDIGVQNVADQTCILPVPTSIPSSSPALVPSAGPSPFGNAAPSLVCDEPGRTAR